MIVIRVQPKPGETVFGGGKGILVPMNAVRKPSDTKKQSLPKPERIVDENDPLFAAISEAKIGMTPQEQFQWNEDFLAGVQKRMDSNKG